MRFFPCLTLISLRFKSKGTKMDTVNDYPAVASESSHEDITVPFLTKKYCK